MAWECPECGSIESTDEQTRCVCGRELSNADLDDSNTEISRTSTSEEKTEPIGFNFEGVISLLIVPVGYFITVHILPDGSSLFTVSVPVLVIAITGLVLGVRSLINKNTNIVNAIFGVIGLIISGFAAFIAIYVLIS